LHSWLWGVWFGFGLRGKSKSEREKSEKKKINNNIFKKVDNKIKNMLEFVLKNE
jgi:hypothetical protein